MIPPHPRRSTQPLRTLIRDRILSGPRRFALLPLLALAPFARADGDCQALVPPDGSWSFGSSELERGYWRAESFVLSEDAGLLTVAALQMHRSDAEGWHACQEDPLPLELRVHAAGGLHPGALLESRLVEARVAALDVGPYGVGWQPVELRIELDPPLAIHEGWLALQGAGDPGCLLLWGAGAGGDGFSRLERGSGWELTPYDLNFCLAAPTCPAPGDLQLRMGASAVRLEWAPVEGAVDYRVEVATEIDGVWATLQLTGGTTRWSGLPTGEQRLFYRVVAICP